MFTNDLLLFSIADVSSISLIFSAFQKISEASWLAASVEKSNIYFCGVSESTARELVGILQMQIG